MTNPFKKIVSKLAKLSPGDQSWILKQLTPKQREQFNELQGNSLLLNANKLHNTSNLGEAPRNPGSNALSEHSIPNYTLQLHQEDPLFIAIILEQGQFSWEQEFLACSEQQHQIKEHLNKAVHSLKPATKSYVFKKWQSQLDFQDLLESAHG